MLHIFETYIKTYVYIVSFPVGKHKTTGESSHFIVFLCQKAAEDLRQSVNPKPDVKR